MSIQKIGVLFVCLGNICRSPAAEGAFKHIVRERELEQFFHIDSCGTANYHIGEEPNEKTVKVAAGRGIVLKHKCRQFSARDFQRFDFILPVDRSNYRSIINQAASEEDKAKVFLLREFDPTVSGAPDVPDPYYGDIGGFEHVQDIVSRCAVSLLDHIIKTRNIQVFSEPEPEEYSTESEDFEDDI